MTRETKLGLIVGGSFLALVGGVMVMKTLFHSSPATTNPEAKATAEVQSPAPAPERAAPADLPKLEPDAQPLTEPRHQPTAVKPRIDPVEISIPDDFGKPNRKPEEQLVIKPVSGNPEMEMPILDKIPPTKPEIGSDPVKIPEMMETPIIVPMPKKEGSSPPIDFAPPKDAIPTKPDLEPLVLDVPAKKELAPMPEVKKDLPPLEIDPKENAPRTTGVTIRPADEKKTNPPALIDIPEPDTKPKIELSPPKKTVEPEFKIVEQKDPETVTPKREETVTPKFTPKPTEDNYEEDLHSSRSGETYPTISKSYYGSVSYATALQKYNKANPAGQAEYIRIPPVWVLEKRYPGDINNSVQPANFAPPQNRETVAPVANVYVVAGTGEYLAEIAQKTLGDEDAWTRIKELNKNINEVKRIPGGTRLVMPANARIPGN